MDDGQLDRVAVPRGALQPLLRCGKAPPSELTSPGRQRQRERRGFRTAFERRRVRARGQGQARNRGYRRFRGLGGRVRRGARGGGRGAGRGVWPGGRKEHVSSPSERKTGG